MLRGLIKISPIHLNGLILNEDVIRLEQEEKKEKKLVIHFHLSPAAKLLH